MHACHDVRIKKHPTSPLNINICGYNLLNFFILPLDSVSTNNDPTI